MWVRIPPDTPTGSKSVVRQLGLEPRSRRFESYLPDQNLRERNEEDFLSAANRIRDSLGGIPPYMDRDGHRLIGKLARKLAEEVSMPQKEG